MIFEGSSEFSVKELMSVIHSHVTSASGGLAAEGTTGTIVNPKYLGGKWLLVVHWDDGHEEMFAKKDAIALLRF